MKKLEEYQEEQNKILAQLQELERQKNELTTRAVELQGIIRELGSSSDKDMGV